MSFFTHGDNYLEYHNAGETLRIMAWGKNSLRVISVPNGPLDLSSSALLPQEAVETNITIGEDTARFPTEKFLRSLIPVAGTAPLS